jgi:5'-nucleotidase
VLGGHSHTYLTKLEREKNADGIDVFVDQNGKHGVFIGDIRVTLTKK